MENFAKAVGIVILAVLGAVAGVALNGFTISMLWMWFVMPLFGLQALSIAQAAGLWVFAKHVVGKKTADDDETDDEPSDSKYDKFGKAILQMIGYNLGVLILGYILSLFV